MFGDPVVATALLNNSFTTPSSCISRAPATACASTPTSFRKPCARKRSPARSPTYTSPDGRPKAAMANLRKAALLRPAGGAVELYRDALRPDGSQRSRRAGAVKG